MAKRTIVWGAPCSGKTTYVKKHAKKGDAICDYDAIYQALSGLGSKVRAESLNSFVLDVIDRVHDEIEKHNEIDAWIITATRNLKKRDRMVKRFSAELVVLDVPREEAHRRCDEDGRPNEWHQYIDNWFDATTKGFENSMEKKRFNFEIDFKENSENTGKFTAIFSRFNEVDKHGDITLPGAFTENEKVKISAWGHNWGSLPVGRGTIHSDSKKAWVDGQFFLNTTHGMDTYNTVKGLGNYLNGHMDLKFWIQKWLKAIEC